MDLKAAAKQYWSQGLPIVVLKEKKPLHEWQKWQSQKQTEEEFESLPWSQADGFAVICGSQLSNGLFFTALDFDVKNLSENVVEVGKQVLKFMPITQMEETPSKGQHWIYYCRVKPKSIVAFHNVAALELIGENKLLIMAPSQGYRRLNDNTPTVVENLENLFLEALAKAGVKTKTEKPEAKAWFDREDLVGSAFKGVAPPCISKLLAGTETGNRNEFAIRLSSYLVNFRKVDVKKAWKELKEWNEWNTPALPESELKACFQSAVKNRYVYGCNDSILAGFCDKQNCSLAKKQEEPEKVYEPEVEAELASELEKILACENQLEALKPHLDNVIVGEEESKKAIFVLLSGSKYAEAEYKQIILLKGTEGTGKSTLMRNLTEGYKVKDVGRFTAHA
ncbi:MAG: bifunctional DNA primase/polymerase, partial [Candidatus Bathyarchaeia archaeon]